MRSLILAVVVLVTVATPAMAQVVVSFGQPACGFYYAPPVVCSPAPAYYYAPPPVYYPQPMYYRRPVYSARVYGGVYYSPRYHGGFHHHH